MLDLFYTLPLKCPLSPFQLKKVISNLTNPPALK